MTEVGTTEAKEPFRCRKNGSVHWLWTIWCPDGLCVEVCSPYFQTLKINEAGRSPGLGRIHLCQKRYTPPRLLFRLLQFTKDVSAH